MEVTKHRIDLINATVRWNGDCSDSKIEIQKNTDFVSVKTTWIQSQEAFDAIVMILEELYGCLANPTGNGSYKLIPRKDRSKNFVPFIGINCLISWNRANKTFSLQRGNNYFIWPMNRNKERPYKYVKNQSQFYELVKFLAYINSVWTKNMGNHKFLCVQLIDTKNRKFKKKKPRRTMQ